MLYYRTLVPKEDREVFEAMEAGLLSGQPSFRVPRRPVTVLSAYAEWVRLDLQCTPSQVQF